jgi:pyruvate dehydrogenase E2 component (dihydrolipoamide acetyltransferase)
MTTDKQIVMPKLGLTMTEATISEWLKTDGDSVQPGEVLFTFESDKATLEFEAPVGGTLRILVPAGETVPVMTPVAVLSAGDAGSVTPIPAPAAADAQSAPTPARSPAAAPVVGRDPAGQTAARIKASPKARHLARQRGLNLAGITGSGPRGMIVSADLDRLPVDAPAAVDATPVARRMAADLGVDLGHVTGTGTQGQITRRDVAHTVRTAMTDAAPPTAPADADLSGVTGLRGIIARRLSAGWQERPQVTLTTDADATNLAAARQQAIQETGEKIAYDALLVMLVARALGEFPAINSQLTPKGIRPMPTINIGVAVDTERGLMVPVIHEADTLPLLDLNRAVRGAAQRAIEGSSQPDELSGGTFTITNLGMFGIDAFTPIINPPECAIMGAGRIVSRPVGVEGQIVLRDMMALSLSFDHRLVDGAPAARFLQRVKTLIEQPFALAFLP